MIRGVDNTNHRCSPPRRWTWAPRAPSANFLTNPLLLILAGLGTVMLTTSTAWSSTASDTAQTSRAPAPALVADTVRSNGRWRYFYQSETVTGLDIDDTAGYSDTRNESQRADVKTHFDKSSAQTFGTTESSHVPYLYATPDTYSEKTSYWRANVPQVRPSAVTNASDSNTLSLEPSKLLHTSLETQFRDGAGATQAIPSNRSKTYWDIKLRSSIADGLFNADVGLAQSLFDPDNPFDLESNRHRNLNVSLRGSLQGFGYGSSWRTTGEEFKGWKKNNKGKKDTEQWSNWISLSEGDVTLKASYQLKSNNVYLDPKKPRHNDETVEFTLNHALKQWPYLGYSLTYGTGSRESSYEPENYKPFKGSMDSLTGSVYYSANTWDASFSTWHTRSDEKFGGNRDSNTLGHTLSASFYPIPRFSVTPYLNLSEEHYAADDSSTSSRSLGLSIYKGLRDKKLALDAYGFYYQNRNLAWDYNIEGVYAQAGITWNLQRKPDHESSLGVYITHNRYSDKVYTASSSDDTEVWVTYRIRNLQPLFFSNNARLNTQDIFSD